MSEEFQLLNAEKDLIKNISDAIEQVFVKKESSILDLMKILHTSYIVEMNEARLMKYQLFKNLNTMWLDTAFNLEVRNFFKKNPDIFKYDPDYRTALSPVLRVFKRSGLAEDEELLISVHEDDENGFASVKHKNLELNQISKYLQPRFTTQLKNELFLRNQYTRLFRPTFLEWREEKLKYQDLTNSLPELEGIF